MSKCIQISGKQGSLYIRDEDEFGKSYTTGFRKVPFNSLSLSESQNTVKSEEIVSGKEPSRPGKGNLELTGSVEMYLRSEAIYPWFKPLFGSVSTVAAGALHKHTFTNTEGCSDSIQLDLQYKGEGVSYKNKGVKVNSMSFNLVEEGDAKVSMDLIGSRQKLVKIIPDSFEIEVEVAANINSKTLDVVAGFDFDELSVGDNVVMSFVGGTTASAYTGVKSLKLTAGHGVSRYDNVLVNGVEYDVTSVAGDIISLGDNITVAAGDTVEVLNETNKVVSKDVALSTITLVNGIKKDLAVGSKIKVSKSQSDRLYGKAFNNFSVSINSGDGRLTTGIESFTLNFNTNKEAKRDINSSGSVSSISDGDIEMTVELGLLFTYEKAQLLNDAKNGLVTDMTITMTNEDGETLEFILPQGDLTGSTPETTPAGISTTITFTPFATEASKMLKVELTNSIASY